MTDLADVTVLILDDEQMVRENLEAFLEDEGLRVLTASNGEEALNVLAANTIMVGVVDMRLPGMAGSEFIVKAHALSPETRFIVHTGSTNYKLPRELRAIGITRDEVFIKPLADMQVILDATARLLGRGA
ncbi:response regulator [Desulfocurvus sp.]|jgi:DNA-binding NtrC family response regulator|uniref:response regulator n=1 Tax=Desulfocurvus sp. TaxID=2871698 RepID=UPI0025C5D077|nr:response regulator [Desulfocurvus sp.]MCK9241317.1 response regulator [Desulfocurvus sp.]